MKRSQHLKAILTVTNTSDLYCTHKSRGLALRTVGSGSSTAIDLRTVNIDRVCSKTINDDRCLRWNMPKPPR